MNEDPAAGGGSGTTENAEKAPASGGGLFSILMDVNVVVDVVGAVAVVPVALGAVAELHVGGVLVRQAAHRDQKGQVKMK